MILTQEFERQNSEHDIYVHCPNVLDFASFVLFSCKPWTTRYVLISHFPCIQCILDESIEIVCTGFNQVTIAATYITARLEAPMRGIVSTNISHN